MRGLGVLCWVAPLCPSCRRCRSPRWWVDKQHPCCCWNAPENRPNAVSHTWLWCISSSPAGGCQGGTKKGQDLVKGWAIECATPHSHLSSADVGVLLKCAQIQEHDSLPTTYFVPEKKISLCWVLLSILMMGVIQMQRPEQSSVVFIDILHSSLWHLENL